MFKPTSTFGKLFRKYILTFSHPAKIRIQNLIGRNVFTKDIEIQNENGVKFHLDANDWITRTILMDGNYEHLSTTLAKKLLTDGGIFMDIGANFGLFTCIVAKDNEKVHVIAIEPNYQMIPKLLNNLRSNSLEQRVQVRNVAIGSQLEFVTLEQPASDNAGTMQTIAVKNGLLSILSCPLEYICNDAELTIIHLIKIDIEGSEFEVFKKFPFHKYHVKNIIMEFNHLSPINFFDLQKFFGEIGFECLSVKGILLHSEDNIEENNIWLRNRNKS